MKDRKPKTMISYDCFGQEQFICSSISYSFISRKQDSWIFLIFAIFRVGWSWQTLDECNSCTHAFRSTGTPQSLELVWCSSFVLANGLVKKRGFYYCNFFIWCYLYVGLCFESLYLENVPSNEVHVWTQKLNKCSIANPLPVRNYRSDSKNHEI